MTENVVPSELLNFYESPAPHTTTAFINETNQPISTDIIMVWMRLQKTQNRKRNSERQRLDLGTKAKTILSRKSTRKAIKGDHIIPRIAIRSFSRMEEIRSF